MATACAHIDLVQTVIQPKQHVCEACVKIGAHWLHLRTCQTCGATLCCDSSPNRHASKHAKTSLTRSLRRPSRASAGLYCYPDEAFAEY